MREILDLLAAMIISPPGSPDPKASRRGHPRFLIFRVLQKLMMLMMLAHQRFEAGLLALPCLRLRNEWKLLPCGCGLARRIPVHGVLRPKQTYRPGRSSMASKCWTTCRDLHQWCHHEEGNNDI